MRSNEERVVEVKRRIAEKERQKKLRLSRIAAVSAVAVLWTMAVQKKHMRNIHKCVKNWSANIITRQWSLIFQRCATLGHIWQMDSSFCF